MKLDARRAIEALRAGVPNGDAVRFLGANQEDIIDRFSAGLLVASGEREKSDSRGFILEGEFGSGKSHVLRALKEEAKRQNFACSLVVVSKETPLSDLDAVYKAAIRELTLPDRQGGDLNEVVLRLDQRSEQYGRFYQWIVSGDSHLDPLFAATLLLYQRLAGDSELRDAIQNFWAGSRVNISQLKKELKYLGEAGHGLTLRSRKNADLAWERFSFAARLIRAAGYKGWVLLLDEIELIAQFPLLGRARSYAGLMRLLGYDDEAAPNLYTVAAATEEFSGNVLQEKRDEVKIAERLAAKDPTLAARAQRALKEVIDESVGPWEHVNKQKPDDLDRAYAEIRELYRLAFDWEGRRRERPPSRDEGRSMRMHVREWITRWDLERLDPSYDAAIDFEALRPDLQEREGLEGLSEPEDEGTAAAAAG